MLDSINFPEAFDKEHRYRFLLRQVLLRHQIGGNSTEVLLSPDATSYFIRKEQWENAALSEYAQAICWMKKKQYKRAVLFFKNALTIAQREEKPSLNGLILLETGTLYLKQNEWALADATLQRARANVLLSGNSTQEADALLKLGSVREQIGDYEAARTFRREALNKASRSEEIANCRLALCQLYYILDQKDSLIIESQKLRQVLSEVEDPSIRSDCWQFLAQCYQESGQLSDARLANAQLNVVLSDVISGQNDHHYLNETAKLDRIRALYSDKMRSRKTIMNSMIVLSMLIILYVLIRNKRQRIALQEAESRIQTLQTLAMEFDRKEDNLRQLALKHFDILKKVALLDGMMNELKTSQEKKIHALFNQAVYENNVGFDWDTFFGSLNQLKEGIPERVRQAYPQLTETEYRVLILSFTGLTNKETSIILNLSTNTINSLRSSIRKKLQVPEYGDLEEFVTTQLRK
jgi:DNA-binding CsgD family transcriptional regulator/tetratricopeptide (TPR) repeat protein